MARQWSDSVRCVSTVKPCQAVKHPLRQSDSPTVRQWGVRVRQSDNAVPFVWYCLGYTHGWQVSSATGWAGTQAHSRTSTTQKQTQVNTRAWLGRRPCLLVPPAQLLDQWFDSLCWCISQQGNAPRPSDLISTKEKCHKRKWGYLRSLGESCRS